MTKNTIDDLNCSIADALNLIGEWWTILIIREAFFGSCRFEDFQKHLGIARNILSTRLHKLCDGGILERVPVKQGAKRHEYKLTPMGKDLYPILIALSQWGDRWMMRTEGEPVKFIERASGEEVQDIAVLSKDGRPLKASELALIPGPGATAENIERLKQIAELWLQREQDAGK